MSARPARASDTYPAMSIQSRSWGMLGIADPINPVIFDLDQLNRPIATFSRNNLSKRFAKPLGRLSCALGLR